QTRNTDYAQQQGHSKRLGLRTSDLQDEKHESNLILSSYRSDPETKVRAGRCTAGDAARSGERGVLRLYQRENGFKHVAQTTGRKAEAARCGREKQAKISSLTQLSFLIEGQLFHVERSCDCRQGRRTSTSRIIGHRHF
ncbi:MAG: hypothetical protein K0Q73_9198, partial [Paenibacillus sp.]|nr:hypothetical protein [Paenibacillus sp.]